MEILKPGKVEMRKFVCPKCGCEFAASENELDYNFGLKRYMTICPNLYCREHIELSGGEPYEEPTPTQSDEALLAYLIHSSNAVDFDTALKLSPWLIAHGVTFKEENT